MGPPPNDVPRERAGSGEICGPVIETTTAQPVFIEDTEGRVPELGENILARPESVEVHPSARRRGGLGERRYE